MIDLHGVARHLRLSVDQLRNAADLLQQGYHPAFIERYRADETGALPRSALWTLKLEIERQQKLAAARQKAQDQLPKDAALDDEAAKYLERASTEVEIDATLKAFRARRALQQSQERDSQAGHLLEMLIAYDGPKINDIEQWVSDQLGVDKATGVQALQQTSRLIANLIQCDTPLNERLRRAIQRKAIVRVELCDSSSEDSAGGSKPAPAKPTSGAAPGATTPEQPAVPADASQANADAVPTATINTTESAQTHPLAATESAAPADVAAQPATPEQAAVDSAAEDSTAEDSASSNSTAGDIAATESTPGDESTGNAPEVQHDDVPPAGEHADDHHEHDGPADHDDHDEHTDHDDHAYGDGAEETSGTSARAGKSKRNAKLTPRQRRRRWLISMLQPMKSLKRPLTQLTAYQQLMLGRGRRSQLVKTHLEYDVRGLVPMARDSFVSDRHPLARWFESAVEQALENTTRAKIEADAVADLEEIAQDKLLEGSAEQLRQHLMRRPVRGHTIMLVDTVGPKLAAVVVVNPQGDVLAIEELPCSAQAEVVNQNVVKLGELAHKFRVTLVALTNGPARRFLVLTIRELMRQSADSGLRWTMADRGGAEAYAAGRTALKELSAYNRRDRAAIWIARSLQNPLAELLKVDVNRMRLGSYQRELPQDSLKKLVQDVIADCVCSRGIDTHHASINELLYVPGVDEAQARQIAELASAGKIESRAQLGTSVIDWPEVDLRQAIGWLRVFGSEQALDATAIHPEDYHLAQRLIDNTEFTTPPNAPENWNKRVAVASATLPTSETPVADSAPVAITDPDQLSPAAVDTSELGATSPTNATGESAEQPTGNDEADVAAEERTTEASAAASIANEAAPVSEGEAASQDQSAGALPAGDVAIDEASMSFKTAPAPEAAPTIKPEYPEDIAPADASAGPAIDIEKLARSWQVGREKLRWIAGCLRDPFADARLAGTPIPLRTDMPTLTSLEPGMCVWAVVVGVADFGAFVEISPDCSGLIHISRLSSSYVEDPHQSVQVGDLLLTWVVATDEKKNRVALTALSPAERAAAEAANQERRENQRESSGENRGRGGQRRGERTGGGAPAGAGAAPAGDRSRSGGGGSGGGGRSQGGGGRGQAGGRGQSGHGSSGGHGGRGRGRNAAPRTAKTVVVASKKPKAPISEAMKEGEEPLRSFSDLLQFYEAKRTEDSTPPAPSTASSPDPSTSSSSTEE